MAGGNPPSTTSIPQKLTNYNNKGESYEKL
nr:MAG TPA: hypothetical protein [Caudoviricetes sp.]DAJ85047.1 MAG TPA: hypothetical protein [Caudoviricetes sp.]DAQ88600.1 MAG TPA: hypothetical protein [Caudoviricetes sp.]